MCRSLNLGTDRENWVNFNQFQSIPHLSHWLHKGVPHHNRDICSTEIARIVDYGQAMHKTTWYFMIFRKVFFMTGIVPLNQWRLVSLCNFLVPAITCIHLSSVQALWCPPRSACAGCCRGSAWIGRPWQCELLDHQTIGMRCEIITWRAPQADQCRSSSQTWKQSHLKICMFLFSLPSSDGSIQLPGNICCPQNKDPVCIVSNSLTIILYQVIAPSHCVLTDHYCQGKPILMSDHWILGHKMCTTHLHLHKELRLDSPRGLGLVVRSGATQWVNLDTFVIWK